MLLWLLWIPSQKPTGKDYIYSLSLSPLFIYLSISREISKVGDKRIYLFTDASSDCCEDQLGNIIAGIRSHGIELVVM